MNKVVLIPAYKPNEHMLTLLEELHSRQLDIVVVDDGSGDEYKEVFENAASFAVILRHEQNKGKGEALKYGIGYIDNSYEKPYVCITADADGQHRVEDILKIADTAAEHPDSLVLGKRTLYKSSPFLSRLGNGATRLFYHLATGRYVYETQTGLRGFSDRLTPVYLKLPGKRYEYESDMMLISADMDIIEVDIETVYFDNNSGSHFDPVVDTFKLHREYFRYKLPSMIAAAADYLLFVVGMLLSGSVLISQLYSRTLALLLKSVLHKSIFYCEKLKLVRFIVSSLIILACDTGIVVGLSAVGLSPYIAKLISGFTMIFLSVGLRKLFVRFIDKR